jgi:hypothetical protein
MNEERIEAHCALACFGNRLCRCKRNAVGAALDEGVEGEAVIERRTEQRLARCCRTRCGSGRNGLLDDMAGLLGDRTTRMGATDDAGSWVAVSSA